MVIITITDQPQLCIRTAEQTNRQLSMGGAVWWQLERVRDIKVSLHFDIGHEQSTRYNRFETSCRQKMRQYFSQMHDLNTVLQHNTDNHQLVTYLIFLSFPLQTTDTYDRRPHPSLVNFRINRNTDTSSTGAIYSFIFVYWKQLTQTTENTWSLFVKAISTNIQKNA